MARSNSRLPFPYSKMDSPCLYFLYRLYQKAAITYVAMYIAVCISWQSKEVGEGRFVAASGPSISIKVSLPFPPSSSFLDPRYLHALLELATVCLAPQTPVRSPKSKWFGYFWKVAGGVSLPAASLQSDFPRTGNPEFDRSVWLVAWTNNTVTRGWVMEKF